jgi:hypothetical protein
MQPAVRFDFTIQPQDPKLGERRIRELLQSATNDAVKAARREHEMSAELTVPGAFGGVGEIAIAVKVLLPYLKDIGSELGRGTLEAAAAYFFTQYLAPRLRKLNLLPTAFRAEADSAAEGEPSKKPVPRKAGKKMEKQKRRAGKKSTGGKKG